MNNNCLNILKWTEAQLKYTYDVSLQEATPQELHEALGQAVMMAISDDWSHSKKTRMPNRKAYYISAEYLIGRLVYSNLFNLGILDEMKELFAEHGVDLAILENVGNLVCPAEFDTGACANAMILSVPEGDDKPLKYPLMFSICDVVLINKIDALPIFDTFSMERARENILMRNPNATIIPICAKTGEGVDQWAQWLRDRVAAWKADA